MCWEHKLNRVLKTCLSLNRSFKLNWVQRSWDLTAHTWMANKQRAVPARMRIALLFVDNTLELHHQIIRLLSAHSGMRPWARDTLSLCMVSGVSSSLKSLFIQIKSEGHFIWLKSMLADTVLTIKLWARRGRRWVDLHWARANLLTGRFGVSVGEVRGRRLARRMPGEEESISLEGTEVEARYAFDLSWNN